MAPDTALHSRSLARIVYFCALALTSLFSPTGKTARLMQGKTLGFCMAGSETVAYFSPIYDTKLNPGARISGDYIAREFIEYLKGRYDLVPQGPFPAGCPVFGRITDAEATRSKFMTEARQTNKQVVEVNWNFVMDEEI